MIEAKLGGQGKGRTLQNLQLGLGVQRARLAHITAPTRARLRCSAL